jgi:hypothetical protein
MGISWEAFTMMYPSEHEDELKEIQNKVGILWPRDPEKITGSSLPEASYTESRGSLEVRPQIS